MVRACTVRANGYLRAMLLVGGDEVADERQGGGAVVQARVAAAGYNPELFAGHSL